MSPFLFLGVSCRYQNARKGTLLCHYQTHRESEMTALCRQAVDVKLGRVDY